MQLSLNMNCVCYALICVVVLTIAGCHASPNRTSAVHVSLCDLYANPAAYDGKLVTVTATMTQLPEGKYIYPGPLNECTYSFIKVDASHVHNRSLTELESASISSPVRKEFDLELTGTFEASYHENWDAFRYRIVLIEVKPQSPIKNGKPMGAA